jgi:TPR repeat protein
MDFEEHHRASNLLLDAKQEFADKPNGYEEKVIRLVKEALALGHPEAKFAAAYLAMIDFPGAETYRPDVKRLVSEAAGDGYPYAYHAAGSLQEKGDVPGASDENAFKQYLLGACSGDARCVYELARLYWHGISVKEDRGLSQALMKISLSRAYFGSWD